jgi:hypothetical protein
MFGHVSDFCVCVSPGWEFGVVSCPLFGADVDRRGSWLEVLGNPNSKKLADRWRDWSQDSLIGLEGR